MEPKTKHYIIPIMVILVLVAIGYVTWYYFAQSPEKDEHIENLIPHISRSKITITDIDGEHITYHIHASISNPFPVKLNTKRIQYQVYIDTAMIAESSYEEKLSINSSGSISLDLPMEASLKRMLGIFKEFEKQHTDSTNYKIITQVYVTIPAAGEQKFDFTIVKRLPAILVPKLKLADADIKKLGFKESGINMSFIVENPNQFPLKLNKGHLSVTLDKNIEMESTIADILVEANGMQTVPVHFDLKTNQLGSAAWKILFNKKNTHFNVVFKGIMDTKTEILKNTNLVITASGTLNEALDTVKELK